MDYAHIASGATRAAMPPHLPNPSPRSSPAYSGSDWLTPQWAWLSVCLNLWYGRSMIGLPPRSSGSTKRG